MTDSKETCEMLPCPLCGRQPDYQHFNISQNTRGRIICTCGLGLTQGRNDTEDGTILKWNTRSDHAVQAASERKAEQAIAATVGVGTCKLVDNDSGPDMHCTACGGEVDDEYRYFMDSWGYSRCPHCGARIIEEATE